MITVMTTVAMMTKGRMTMAMMTMVFGSNGHGIDGNGNDMMVTHSAMLLLLLLGVTRPLGLKKGNLVELPKYIYNVWVRLLNLAKLM